MNEATKEKYCTVVYTDGTKFISPMMFGRETTVNLPKAKFNPKDKDDVKMQAVLALFAQTGIREDPADLESIGTFSSDENFEMDVFYKKVEALPLKTNLKSNVMFSLVHDRDIRVNAIEGYEYISFSKVEDYNYSLKGMKNVLWQIDQHFEEGIAWADIA